MFCVSAPRTRARLCLMAQKTDLLVDLRQAVDAEAMCECILVSEQAVLADRQHLAESS
jgi:hypothetical protein